MGCGQVSFLRTAAGWLTTPRWRTDGKELFYDDFVSLNAVEVDDAGAAFRVGASKPLFQVGMRVRSREYDVSRDGQRFLMITENQGASQSLMVVQNWLAELKKK